MRLIAQLLSLLVRGTALMLGLLGSLLALASLGGAINPKLDALTHITPLWLAMGIGAVLLGGLFAREAERWVMVALGVVAISASGVLMLPELRQAWRFKPEAAAPSDLKVIQFNAWHENYAPEQSLEWLLAQNADVIVMAEGGGSAWAINKGLRATYPYMSCKSGRCEPWIFSRKKVIASGTVQKGLPGAWATIEDPAGSFTVLGAHYVWPVPAGRQQAQSAMLVKAASAFDPRTLIVTGDFNSTPWSFTLKRQDKALALQRLTRALPSWPSGQFSRVATAPAPFLPIDHVYAGADWRAVKVERGPAIGSDHRPIVVTLRRQPK
ncbi:endonuclease/exonuclease/phosphatase family protein [Caulobacter segnis]|uniref:endonuclease/exonuclease/phosphatase family protein n=1 Tax=Caulobacter segnis TaxID=88688 RepID=UPI00285B8AEB|nr:endonuclease/exonuclease/phosphatase family protein [Caulobacter segnis]MDR6625164.1 endonuclease/exonuclease/phosphatase (EEP) superfamily protein YafD [Caulobacter segnis]